MSKPLPQQLTSLSVRSDIRSYTVYICNRCGVMSGSPSGICEAARPDLPDPADRLGLHDFVPVEFVPGSDFLRVEAEAKRLRQGLWDCATAAGVDTDGDTTPDHLTHPDIVVYALEAIHELRQDYIDGGGG